jgi:hypothetical protein
MALTLGFLLLVFADVWTSTAWQVRTGLPVAPWLPGARFEKKKTLAIADPLVAEAIRAWGDKIRKKEHQRDQLAVYNANPQLRKTWRGWVKMHSRYWKLNDTIDKYLQDDVGVDLVGYMRQQKSREVYTSLDYYSLLIP